MKKLLIVESPTKARAFKSGNYLSKDFIIEASKGHVRDLPDKKIGVDVKNNFEPEYEISKDKVKDIEKLKKEADKCDIVYLAPDPDREGEAIAWHLKEILQEHKPDLQFKRVKYNQINKRAVNEAIENPTEIDLNIVNAQQARRILDRLVGFKVSPLLWKWISRGLSAGRVQSVGLRIVSEKEMEIRAFVPTKYFDLEVKLDNGDVVTFKLQNIDGKTLPTVKDSKIKAITDEALAKEIFNGIKGYDFTVKSVKTSDKKIKPSGPFITSSLQQAASSLLGFSPTKTMTVAQSLYEGVKIDGEVSGLITYMRTDSYSISPEALTTCREYIARLGDEYLPESPNYYSNKKGAQEAHEAIRPTDAYKSPAKIKSALNGDQFKLYSLIWRRFVASQMTESVNSVLSLKVEATNGTRDLGFGATSSKMKFDGFKQVYTYNDKETEQITGDFKAGQSLKYADGKLDEKATKPPKRYTEASLIKALEDNEIGRPSTYASILSTLKNRKYITIESKAIHLSELGEKVNEWDIKYLEQLFNVGFTAGMESQLDDIESGKLDWKNMLKEFYTPFEGWLEGAQPPKADNSKVEQVIALFNEVSTWEEPKKIGRRTYDDNKFVKSIEKQMSGGKQISEKQLNFLITLAEKYTEQIKDLEGKIKKIGIEVAKIDEIKIAVSEDTKELIGLLKSVKFDAPTGAFDENSFFESLSARVDSGKELTTKQLFALKKIVSKYSSQVENFEEISKKYNIADQSKINEEATELFAKMKDIPEEDWKEAKGKKDIDFYDSLKTQFAAKGSLSSKQVFSLKRMAIKYGVVEAPPKKEKK